MVEMDLTSKCTSTVGEVLVKCTRTRIIELNCLLDPVIYGFN